MPTGTLTHPVPLAKLEGKTPAVESVWLSFQVLFLLGLSLVLNIVLLVRLATLGR